jgi:hypothetical protein
MERAGFKPYQPLAPQELVEMHLHTGGGSASEGPKSK